MRTGPDGTGGTSVGVGPFWAVQPGEEIGDLAGLLVVPAEENAHVLVESVEDTLGLGAAAIGEEEHTDTAVQIESGLGGVPGRVGHDLQDLLELPQGYRSLTEVGSAVGGVPTALQRAFIGRSRRTGVDGGQRVELR